MTMSTPRRRSSRIRAGSATPAKSISYNTNRLASLAENEESPVPAVPSIHDNVLSTPKTPVTGKVKPSLGEMHPSKVQQSTTKEPDSGLRFGFADIGVSNNQQTPSKSAANSSFEFRFARPGPQLSADAQKMMDDLRGEAMRVKAKLVADREDASRKAEVEMNVVGGRKMAQPKGKVGRFSDIHMAEFKKMDSIADHPSSFRAQPGRLSPAKPALKRTQSQAKLEERENIKVQSSSSILIPTERLENDAPAKRIRKGPEDDASASRLIYDVDKSSITVKQITSLTAITTPTKSSLARAASIKKPVSQIPALSKSPSKASLITTPRSTTHIPTLSKSPSKQSLITTPRGAFKPSALISFNGVPRSEPKAFFRSPGKVDRLRSMLRYPSASARKPVAAASALPVFSLSPSKPNCNKELPSLPSTPGGLERTRMKHVTFTPDTLIKNANSTHNSPSPIKSAIPLSSSKSSIFTKTKNTPNRPNINMTKPVEISYPSIADHPSLKEETAIVEYPTLASVRPLPSPPHLAKIQFQGPPSVPGTFTFRSDHTIDFGSSPKGFGSSAGQASVRQVRPSIFPTMPGSFPISDKENTAPVPALPRSFSNKKRHCAGSDEEREEQTGRSPKKLKTDFTYGSNIASQKVEEPKSSPSKGFYSPAKKKGMSLSRLNMLARPKMRK